MRSRHELAGMKFNMLTAIKRVNETGRSHWLCQCDCGKTSVVEATNLIKLKVVSCGCSRDEKARREATKHGRAKQSINNIWCGMKQRTRNPNCPAYQHYGARGIEMCDEWHDSFLKFYEYFGDPPFAGASLERIDNDLGYFPGNVKWATRKDQMNNTRRSRKITLNGVTMTLSQWADKSGINRHTIACRINAGWPLRDAIFSKPSPLTHKNRKDCKP